ncbi:MAG: biopolymer transporter ExbD [Myxococcota bacterium]
MPKKLTAAQRAYIKKHTAYHEPGPDEIDDELNIVPFLDIVVNLIMFLLMSISSVAFYAQVEASLPSYSRGGVGSRPNPDERPLNLNLTVVDNGFILAGSGGKLAPGCQETATGSVITVPKTGASYDLAALRTCATRVKAEFPDEVKVTVSADPLIEYQYVVQAMDAVRENDEGETLFDEVLLSAGVR